MNFYYSILCKIASANCSDHAQVLLQCLTYNMQYHGTVINQTMFFTLEAQFEFILYKTFVLTRKLPPHKIQSSNDLSTLHSVLKKVPPPPKYV